MDETQCVQGVCPGEESAAQQAPPPVPRTTGPGSPGASTFAPAKVSRADRLTSVLGEASNDPNPPRADIRRFTDIAPVALGDNGAVDNQMTGVAIFDYDRDGDLDFYVTQGPGHPNLLFRNDGNRRFAEVAAEAGVATPASNSTGVVACDLDNDGFQDLYVATDTGREEDFDREAPGFDAAYIEGVKDRLFLNKGDGTFEEVTDAAFGEETNFSRASSVVCADVDRDGWLDIYVTNRTDPVRLVANDWYNALYHNNGDLTFTNIASGVAVQGHDLIRVQDENLPNKVVSWAAMFFDYDDDGDPDLFVANDSDRFRVHRNDTQDGRIRFTSVERAMGLDMIGNWMGFALGDYDGDADLDIFVTNIGFHEKLKNPPAQRRGECAWVMQFEFGTCDHFLLRNDGLKVVPGVGTVGDFYNVAPSTSVDPSPLMPPASLEPLNIKSYWQVPTGLAAYDFGFGAAFFDLENDGDQDLYWLGSLFDRGEAPRGMSYPSAGRMLRGDGRGGFQDVTVETGLLDIRGVDYSVLDPNSRDFDPRAQRIAPEFHENGKGLAKGDLDGDGYVDLIGTNAGGDIYVSDGAVGYAKGPIFVWLNPGGDNHWLTLRLKGRMAIDGTGSNADGIGARVYLRARVSGDQPVTLVDEVTNSSFLSMNSLDLYFGLGQAQVADEITIFWPSGLKQVLASVAADQVLTVEEPAQ